MAYWTNRQVSRVVDPAFRTRKAVENLSLLQVFFSRLITLHISIPLFRL